MRFSALWFWLLTCTCIVPMIGAEYVWPTEYSGDQAPAGWDLSTAANTTQQFSNGSISFKGPLAAFQTLSRPVGMDGNDRQPLVISAVINSEQPRELGGLPTFIALYWNPTHAFFIGVGGMSEGLERYDPARRRGWAYWITNGKIERRATERQLYSSEAPAHVRLLVSGNDISASISTNGIAYETLASLTRKDSVFAVAPERIVIGRGWFGEDAEKRQPLLANTANDPGLNEAVTSVISHVRISNEHSKLPRARLSAKATGFEDIRQEDLDRTTAEHWHLLGPLPNNDKEFGPERTRDTKNGLPLVPGHDLRWKPVTGEGPASRRSINLKTQLDMTQERQVALAITSIYCDAPRFERFWFDGARGIQIFVNGRLVADKNNGWEGDIIPDRFAATTWLNRGENVVVLRLSAAWGGSCRFVFRHDAASPTQLIADHLQAIEAYHADIEGVVLATQVFSQWYETLGQRRLAAELIGQLTASPSTGNCVFKK